MVEKFSKQDLANTRSFKGNLKSNPVSIEKIITKKDLLYLIEKFAFDNSDNVEVIETMKLLNFINTPKGELSR